MTDRYVSELPFLEVSSIENWRANRGTAEAFERALLSLKASLPALPASAFGEPQGLQRVFVQFQFACRDLPGAVHGLRIGRLTKRGGHVSAYVEVTAEEIHGLAPRNAMVHLAAGLLQALRGIQHSLAGRVPHRLEAVLPLVSELTAQAM